MDRVDFLRPYKDRQLLLIETEINLLRHWWQRGTEGEAHLALVRCVQLMEEEKRYL